MSIDLPQQLVESALFTTPTTNFTPLHFSEKKKTSHAKLYVRVLMFLLVVGIFTPSFIYFYRNSSARTLTSDREFMQDIANSSRGKKVASNESQTTEPTLKQENIFTEIVQSIKEAVEKIVRH